MKEKIYYILHEIYFLLQKNLKFSMKNFSSKYLLKKLLMENFIFCTVLPSAFAIVKSILFIHLENLASEETSVCKLPHPQNGKKTYVCKFRF